MAAARRSLPANSPSTSGTMSSATRLSPTPSSIPSSTTPIGWNWAGRPCASSKPTNRQNPRLGHPQNKPPAAQAHRPSRQKETRNDRRAQFLARPGGSTGTSRTRRCISHEGTPPRARVPPIDYRDGLSPRLTSKEETDITTIIQRRPQHPRRSGRDQSEQLVAIRRNEWSRSSECALMGRIFADGETLVANTAPIIEVERTQRRCCIAALEVAGQSACTVWATFRTRERPVA
jgi:hypothetical protein